MRFQSFTSAAAGLAILPQFVYTSAVHQLGRRDEKPGLPVKAGTISTCNYWYDNVFGEDCKPIRDWMFAISPEDFHRWNPSVSLDCGGWEEWYSYCVRVEGYPLSSSTSSKPPPRTTSAAAPAFTPTVSGWEPLGCYTEENTLSTRSTREGGGTLTVDKCQAACWLDAFEIAGLKSGTECWCGNGVLGHWAEDQADCKMPCPGNSSQTCGGDKLLSVFKAVIEVPDLTVIGWLLSSTTVPVPTTTPASTTAPASTTTVPPATTTTDSPQSSESIALSRHTPHSAIAILLFAFGLTITLMIV